MRVDRKLAEKSLSAKGFVKDVSKDHVYFNCYFEGKDTGIATYVSHSAKFVDIGPDILKKMKKQLKLDEIQDVRDFLTCPLTKDKYFEILEKKGFLK